MHGVLNICSGSSPGPRGLLGCFAGCCSLRQLLGRFSYPVLPQESGERAETLDLLLSSLTWARVETIPDTNNPNPGMLHETRRIPSQESRSATEDNGCDQKPCSPGPSLGNFNPETHLWSRGREEGREGET